MTMTGTTKLHPGMSRKEAVRAFVEMRETLRRVEAENADLHKRIKEATEAAVEWQNAYAMNEVYGPTQLEMLRARVTELEAAQQWRPVTEKPLIAMQYQVVVQHSRQQPAADHMAYYPSSGWTGTDVIFWRPIPPLPPAPDAQEPTP